MGDMLLAHQILRLGRFFSQNLHFFHISAFEKARASGHAAAVLSGPLAASYGEKMEIKPWDFLVPYHGSYEIARWHMSYVHLSNHQVHQCTCMHGGY